jgi:hypothetical protein
MQHSSNLQNVSFSDQSALPIDLNTSSHFTKMDARQYKSYIEAHVLWINQVHEIDKDLHEDALRRRFTEKYTEKLVVQTFDDGVSLADYGRKISIPGVHQNADESLPALFFMTEPTRKTPHEPSTSEHPHRAEVRVNKRRTRDARNKAKANAWQAKADVIAERSTVPIIKERLLAIEKVTASAPLHKVELAAATSAAKRAAAIKASSPDLIPEVKPDDGWKLVTRHKGSKDIILAQATKMGAAGTQLHHAVVRGDPALINGAGRVLSAQTRTPTATGVK